MKSPFLPLLLGCALLSPLHAADTAVQPDGTSATHAAKIIRTKEISYPLKLLNEGVSRGEVTVLLQLNEEGVITDTLPVAYTHEPFLKATLDALKEWKYEPGRVEGQPVTTVCEVSIRFEVSGVLVFERFGPIMPHENLGRDEFAYKVQGLRNLDRIPTPLHVAQPVYPKEWISQGLRGSVTVDFYVDETGAVRMPTVGANDHPWLAASAFNAVREWRFTPPTRDGKPVLVRCQQIFNFAPPQSGSVSTSQ
jgi:TonB family protein